MKDKVRSFIKLNNQIDEAHSLLSKSSVTWECEQIDNRNSSAVKHNTMIMPLILHVMKCVLQTLCEGHVCSAAHLCGGLACAASAADLHALSRMFV